MEVGNPEYAQVLPYGDSGSLVDVEVGGMR